MSQPTHLTLALGRARDEKRILLPDLSLTVTYRLEPGETDLGAVVEARADELRAAFTTLCARLGPLPAPLPDPDTDPDEGALEEWRDEDAPGEEDEDDEPDALAEDGDPDEDGPDDRPPTFPGNALPVPSANGHGAVPEPSPPAEPSSRVQQIAARSAAWRAGLSADDLTLLLAQHFGKVRVEQLDKMEAETLLRALQREEVAARAAALH